MIILKKELITQNSSLYSFNIFNATSSEDFEDKALLLFNPINEDFLKFKDKELTVVLSGNSERASKFLHEDNVKKVLIFEYMEAKYLDAIGINKYELVLPCSSDTVNSDKTFGVSCYTPLSDIEDYYLDALINSKLSIRYYGHKVIKNQKDFNKLMRITHSRVTLKPYPIFDLNESIWENTITIEQSSAEFPIVSYKTILFDNTPILYGPRFRRWLLPELQNPKGEFIDDIISDNSRLEDTMQKQKQLFDDYFKDHKRIEDVI